MEPVYCKKCGVRLYTDEARKKQECFEQICELIAQAEKAKDLQAQLKVVNGR